MLPIIDQRFDALARQRALDFLDRPNGVSQERLDRWVEGSGLVVSTGQQPGLMGGPLYCLYKGITAVKLAKKLENLLCRPVFPVFWIASEDHDWEESAHTYLIDGSNSLKRLQITDPGQINRSIHRVLLDKDVEGFIEEVTQSIPKNEFSDHYLKLIIDGYNPGNTLVDGFRTVLSELLGPLGMFFVDAANELVKRSSREILFAELDQAEAHECFLREESEKIEVAGYPVQVPILKGGVNLFLEGSLGRERLYRHFDGFEMHGSGDKITADAIRSRFEDDPLSLSSNVLLRPIVESAILPTVSYVAGPGEISYYGQIKKLYNAHGLKMPIIFPRPSVTVVESKIRKIIDKFSLSPKELMSPHYEVASRIAHEKIPEDVSTAIGKLEDSMREGSRDLLQASQDVDPTLEGPVTRMRNTALSALQEAERKIAQSVKRKIDIDLGQLEKAQVHLFPERNPQERILNPIYYLVRYGNQFIGFLVDKLKVDLIDDTD